MKLQLQPAHKSTALTVGSAVAVTAINYGLFKSPLSLLSTSMLVAHEYGHYFAGHFAGSKVNPPFFIPLGIMTMGATRVSDPSVAPKRIAISGVINGMLAGLVGLLISVVVPVEISILGVIGLLAYEIGWGMLGGDGKKYRDAASLG